jgi:hypothetical protein
LGVAGKKDNRHVVERREFAYPACGRQPVQTREAGVHQDEVGARPLGHKDGGLAVHGQRHPAAPHLQHVIEQEARVVVVFHHQHERLRALRRARRRVGVRSLVRCA